MGSGSRASILQIGVVAKTAASRRAPPEQRMADDRHKPLFQQVNQPHFRSSGRTSPVAWLERMTRERFTPRTPRTAAKGRRPELYDHPQNVSEQISRNGDLRQLEGDIAAVSDRLCADFDQLLFERRQREAHGDDGKDHIWIVFISPRMAGMGLGFVKTQRRPRR
jgi:hypothetical protein